MKKKQLKKRNLNLEKVTISRLEQMRIEGGIVAPPTYPEREHSCSCTCGFLESII